MNSLVSLDAHAHFAPTRTAQELAGTGAVLAMTLSLNEAARVVDREEGHIAWGVGCHPRKIKAQEEFDALQFAGLVSRTAVIGEVGLDAGSRVPMQKQLHTFRQILEIAAHLPRLVSIHSYLATGLVIHELQQRPIAVPILHWWTGNVAETRQAVELGCFFSIHSAVARYSKFRSIVPPQRILVESDHGWGDPPAAISCRIEWAEFLVGQQYGLGREEIRRLAWQNFAEIVRSTDTRTLLPPMLARFGQAGSDW